MKLKTEIVGRLDISSRIITLREHRVILDADLAKLYGVTTKRLKEQVKRNIDRFPSDFMFVLTKQEITNLRSQFATSSSAWGGTRYPPMAFTEHGALYAKIRPLLLPPEPPKRRGIGFETRERVTRYRLSKVAQNR